MDTQSALQVQLPIINLAATSIGKMVVMLSLPPPKNERQQSFDDVWFCMLDTVRAMERL